MKKKLLSLIVLAMSMSAFAQYPMWIDFEHGITDDIVNYWNDWDWYDQQTSCWEFSDDGTGNTMIYTGSVANVPDTHWFGMGNPYTVSSTANCTVSFFVKTYNLDDEAPSASMNYAVRYSIDGGSSWKWYNGVYYTLSSDDGWDQVQMIAPAGSNLMLYIYTLGAEGGDAAFAVDDISFRYGNTYFATFEADDEYGSWTYDAFAAGNSPLPDNPFEREGYTFLYWYTWDVASQEFMGYDPGEMYNFAGDYNYFYAAWGKNIIVRYDANGGQGVMTPDTSCEYNGIIVENCAFTRANYEFTGWNTMANGTGVSYNVGDTIWFDEGDVDITLHAQWRSTGGQQQCSDAYRTLTPINAVGKYIWYGQTYTTSGTFQHRVPGAVEGGCDSIYTLQLTIIPQGIDGASLNEVSVYPNPTMGNVEIMGTTVSRVAVMDLAGRVATVVNGSNMVDMSSLSKGVYMFHIITPDGVAVRKVVKK
ncbi:MAG: T9SS type A sorting domain-containing protein [Bacteroidales bacterium]|nr:T9SS type A sorting domain-containing protein [Candidatus Colimorpha onthohippi]